MDKKRITPRIVVTDEAKLDPGTDRDISIAHCNNGYQTHTMGYITTEDALKIIRGLTRVISNRIAEQLPPGTPIPKASILKYAEERNEALHRYLMEIPKTDFSQFGLTLKKHNILLYDQKPTKNDKPPYYVLLGTQENLINWLDDVYHTGEGSIDHFNKYSKPYGTTKNKNKNSNK